MDEFSKEFANQYAASNSGQSFVMTHPITGEIMEGVGEAPLKWGEYPEGVEPGTNESYQYDVNRRLFRPFPHEILEANSIAQTVEMPEGSQITDPNWQIASRIMYEYTQPKRRQAGPMRFNTAGQQNVSDLSGEEMAHWGVKFMSAFENNIPAMVLNVARLQDAPPEVTRAMYYMLETSDREGVLMSNVWRGLGNVAVDPSTWVGLGTLGIGLAGRETGKQVSKMAFKELLRDAVTKQSVKSSTLAIAGESAFYGAVDNLARQEVAIEAGQQDGIDVGELAATAGISGALGETLGTVAGPQGAELVKRGAGVVVDRLNQPGQMPTTSSFGAGEIDRGLAAAGRLDAPKAKTSFYVQAREGGAQNEAARSRVLEIAQAKGNKKPKIEDLVDYFEQNHQQIYGRKLDPNVEEDFEIVVNSAADEILYQLDQAVSGRGWYDSDVKKTFETLAQIPGLERIADDETLRVIWSAFAAPTSIGNKVDLNTRASTAAFLQFLKTGKVPVNPPAKGAVTEGISGAGWGLKQKSVAAGMRVIAHLIETKGLEGFADWWLSPHTLKELTEVRKAAGLGSGPSGLSGGQNSLHLGAMVLGDKTGQYSLNINGYQGTTKDVWFSRSYNRHFGDMRNPDGTIAGGPRNQTERRRMEEFTSRLVDKLTEQGLSEQDAQAVLWFHEQNLFTDLGVLSRPGSFSKAAEKIANDLRSGVRGSDEIEVGAEQAGEGLTGFRGISAPKRTIRSGRRGGEADVQAFGPYTRGSGEGSEGDGLLSLTPDEQTQRIYGEAGIALPNIQQAPTTTAAQYNADMTSAMSGHTYGAQVEIKSAEELANARLFRTENGSGFAIKPDGDIVAVFQSGNETGSVGYAMIQAAVQAGGRKLDAFDTFLPGIYETAGFRPVARLPWNDKFAPDDWNKETFKNFNNGEPDVVFFVYDPNYFGGAADVPKFTDYDDAVAAQDAEIARLKETIDGY